jgi:hypothetical protein
MIEARKPERSIDFLPRAVLAVGITGHRDLSARQNAPAIAVTLDTLFAGLSRAVRTAAQGQFAFFAKADPFVRAVTMAAEGVDLLGAQAAQAAGSAVVCVLPFPFDAYQRDFSSPAAAGIARSVLEGADAQFVLPGAPAEGARSYERANEVITANIDVLIAVWDEQRASGRAGTGEMVQSAIARRIPVILITPDEPTQPKLLAAPDDEELERPIAFDLPRKPLDADLSRFVSQILSPPLRRSSRQGLIDFLEEKDNYRNIRFEYQFLLKLFGVGRLTKASAIDVQPTSPIAGPAHDLATPYDDLLRHIHRIDDLASHYARLYRSSTTSGSILTIVAAFISATVIIIYPSITGVSLLVQMAVNGLVIFDSRARATQRWQERWFDYRVMAERLRCLRFLHPLGLGLAQLAVPSRRGHESWVEWYLRRYERALDPPHGTIEPSDVARFAQRLVDTEIPEQLKYHHANFRQLGLLDRRLAAAARFSLAAAIVVAALYGLSAYVFTDIDDDTWKPIAIVVFFVLPAMATAFNGIRAYADLARLSERSAIVAAALTRLRRIIQSTPISYDHLTVAAARLASIMGDELTEWRFMLESRWARTHRAHKLGRSWFRLRRSRRATSQPQ